MSSRVQLALNVADLESAVKLYTSMFGTEPHKVRPGYANFAVEDPPLKLVLFENAEASGALNHLGVEVEDVATVEKFATRFSEAGLETRTSDSELCCHAVQDKVYVTAPDVPIGTWEFYTIIDDAPIETPGASIDMAGCCSPESEEASSANPCCG